MAARVWPGALAGPAPRAAAARDAIRVACAGDVRDAAHGAREPAVVELQGAGQVGTLAAVRVMPGGGQRGQFPDGVDVAGPAVPELVTGVVLAQHGIGPVPQLGQLGQVCLAVQADPGGGRGPAWRGGVQRVSDAAREFLDTRDEVQVVAQSGAIEPLIHLRDLAAQVRYLRGQGGQTLTESL